MGKEKYLIDTNIAIEYIGETLPEKALYLLDSIFDNHFYISVINKIELPGFASITKEEELKFRELINAAEIIELNEDIVTSTIDIRKTYKTKLPDAIIAATAAVDNLCLVTRNIEDFKNIDIKLLNPFDNKIA